MPRARWSKISWAERLRDEQDIFAAPLSALLTDPKSRKAWGELYTLASARVITGAFRYTGGSRELANDALNEVFKKLLQGCDFAQFGGDGTKFRSYLDVAVKNACIDMHRRRKRDLAVAELLGHEAQRQPSPPDDLAQQHESLATLRRLRPNLKTGEQELLDLLLAGLSPVEIAYQLSLSRDAANQRISRLRGRLKLLMTHK
jgi:RNA polymerase sigma factor (sigma-70 family)